jgi:hypothetical protein
MRLLFGMILGAAVTIGTVFIADTAATGPTTTDSGSAAADHRNMVNWDVVGDNVRVARERAREAWARISHKIAG